MSEVIASPPEWRGLTNTELARHVTSCLMSTPREIHLANLLLYCHEELEMARASFDLLQAEQGWS